MSYTCKRFSATKKTGNPIIFCTLLENDCPKRDAINFSKKKYCVRDTT